MKLEFFIGADDELGTAGTIGIAMNIIVNLALKNALIKDLNRSSYHGNLIGWLPADEFDVDYSLNVDSLDRLIYNGPAAMPDNVTKVLLQLGVTEYTLNGVDFDMSTETPMTTLAKWLPNAAIKDIISLCIADGGQTFQGSSWPWQLRQILTDRLAYIQDHRPEEMTMDYMWLKDAFY